METWPTAASSTRIPTISLFMASSLDQRRDGWWVQVEGGADVGIERTEPHELPPRSRIDTPGSLGEAGRAVKGAAAGFANPAWPVRRLRLPGRRTLPPAAPAVLRHPRGRAHLYADVPQEHDRHAVGFHTPHDPADMHQRPVRWLELQL